LIWEVEFTDEFESWWNGLTEEEQDSVGVAVAMLRTAGPGLRFPYSSGIVTSKHSHMRELRIRHAGHPYRVLYAFDPLRTALLLIGGNKTANDRWYEEYVPVADRLYDEHLKELDKEERIKKHGSELS
jgi:hypothetical protein